MSSAVKINKPRYRFPATRNTQIATRREYELYRPQNMYDTNYWLHNTQSGAVHLIDINDVEDWDSFRSLEDIPAIKELAWKSQS